VPQGISASAHGLAIVGTCRTAISWTAQARIPVSIVAAPCSFLSFPLPQPVRADAWGPGRRMGSEY